MLMIVAVLAQYEIPRSTINYYNYRSRHVEVDLITDESHKKCQMTLKLKKKQKKNVPQFFILDKRVGVQAARKGSEGELKPVLHQILAPTNFFSWRNT